MINVYYKIAEMLCQRRSALWIMVILLITTSLIIFCYGLYVKGSPQNPLLVTVSSIIALVAVGVFWLIPLVDHFSRLKLESEVFRNHSHREVFFTLIFTLIFGSIIISIILICYEVLAELQNA